MGWGILGLAALALVLYWQLIIAEGVYLGQNVVTLLYDWVAPRYNNLKAFDPQDECDYLGRPLSRALGRNFNGIVLDVATGTGRLPAALKRQPEFKGRLIGVDHSARMLAVARQTVSGVPLVLADAMRLPFADNSAQSVTCLEALEFLPNPAGGLRELTRTLSPGGVLLATNRIGWETRLMPGKTWTTTEVHAILKQLPLTGIKIIPWQNIYRPEPEIKTPRLKHLIWTVKYTRLGYDQVWARKKNA